MSFQPEFSSMSTKMKASKIRELMKYASMPGVISLAGGLPDPDSFPFDDVKRIINQWDSRTAKLAMQYGPTTGYEPLVEKLKIRMKEDRHLDMTDQELFITSGGQQSLYLLGGIFIDPGDVVIVEQPSFIGAMAAFLSRGADLKGLPLEDDGINPEDLEKLLITLQYEGKKPKFFYTIPNFHNPAGVTLSQEKRKKIYEISIKYNLVIIEDDPYHALYFSESPDPYYPIKAYGNDAPIVYVGSFSKVLSPGFRLGWMTGDKRIIGKAILSKQSVDACSSTFGQVIAYDYLENGLIDGYLSKMRVIYKQKKDLMTKMINEHLPSQVKATNPWGGFFIYLTLPHGLSAEKVFEKSFEKKVAFVTGEPFHIDPQEGDRHIRISYSNSTDDEILQGIKVIGEALKFLLH